MSKQVHIIGGGTVFHVRPHLALSAPAYGKTVFDIAQSVEGHLSFEGEIHCYTTRMAGDYHSAYFISAMGSATDLLKHEEEDADGLRLETNEDVANLLDKLVADPAPKIVFLPAALCDFDVQNIESHAWDEERGNVHTKVKPGKDLPRLKTADYPPNRDVEGEQYLLYPLPPEASLRLSLVPSEKVISRVRKTRKDIFLVGFKTTTGAFTDEMVAAGLRLLKTSSCNLVLVNDLKTKVNMIVTPEQSAYCITTDRLIAIDTLVDMALQRSEGHFTRSTEVEGVPVQWDSALVPATLRTVVNHCIKRGAYKPFLGATVGHFAFKLQDNKFVTSRRKVDYNELDKVGMVLVETIGTDEVKSYGGKPSVGGQSQRIIFASHPDVDCIVHFHCPLKEGAVFPTRSQAPFECGSHECGQNTSDGLENLALRADGSSPIYAVMLDKHGPNIVFNHDADPQAIIQFIEDNFDLTRSTSEVP